MDRHIGVRVHEVNEVGPLVKVLKNGHCTPSFKLGLDKGKKKMLLLNSNFLLAKTEVAHSASDKCVLWCLVFSTEKKKHT